MFAERGWSIHDSCCKRGEEVVVIEAEDGYGVEFGPLRGEKYDDKVCVEEIRRERGK